MTKKLTGFKAVLYALAGALTVACTAIPAPVRADPTDPFALTDAISACMATQDPAVKVVAEATPFMDDMLVMLDGGKLDVTIWAPNDYRPNALVQVRRVSAMGGSGDLLPLSQLSAPERTAVTAAKSCARFTG